MRILLWFLLPITLLQIVFQGEKWDEFYDDDPMVSFWKDKHSTTKAGECE